MTLVFLCFAEPPRITSAPKDTYVIEENQAFFVCLVAGNPVPTVQWKVNGDLVTSNKARYLQFHAPYGKVRSLLHLRSCYSISGIHVMVSPNPRCVSLTENTNPYSFCVSARHIYTEKVSGALSCHVGGDIVIRSLCLRIPAKSRRLKLNYENILMFASQVLRVDPTRYSADHEASVECVATNALGTDIRTAMLRVYKQSTGKQIIVKATHFTTQGVR